MVSDCFSSVFSLIKWFRRLAWGRARSHDGSSGLHSAARFRPGGDPDCAGYFVRSRIAVSGYRRAWPGNTAGVGNHFQCNREPRLEWC